MSARTLATTPKQTTPMALGAGRILQRKCACGNHAMGGECEGCNTAGGLEGKLTIGATSDPLEQEADRVADRVVGTPAPHSTASVHPIQSAARTSGLGDGAAPPSIERALAGSGTPLQPYLRKDMEQRFGYDFSKVRLHTDDAAARSARDISANAYTSGKDVVFGAGKFSPERPEGRRLLAHELAHVVQQNGAGYAGSSVSGQALVQRDASFPPISPDVAASWGMPSAAPPAKDAGNAHSAPPEHLRPKPQPRTLDAGIAAANVDPHQRKVDKDPPMMTLGDKFKKVITLAITEKLKGEGIERLKELITPEAIAMMAAFTIVYVASQLTPIGWAADILVGAMLAATVLMLGREAIEIVKLLIEFCRKTSNAKDEEDYDEAATLFARAISKLGIDIIVAILFHKAGKFADLKPSGPRSPGLVEILKPRGGTGTIRQPVLQPANGLYSVTASGIEFMPAGPKPPGLMAEGQSGVGGPKGAGGAGRTPAGDAPTGQGAGKPPQKLPGKDLAAADALTRKKPPAPSELIEEAKKPVDSSKAEPPEAKPSDAKPSQAEPTAREPTRSKIRKELRQNLEARIEDLQSRIDEVLLEKNLIQKELKSINNELKSIDDQLKTSKDRTSLLERKRDLEARREQLKKREAEELGSTADWEQQKLKAKELINATGPEYLQALTDAASKRKEYTDVKAGGKDEVFGTTGLSLEVDHVYPRSKIFEIPGFVEKLSWDQQIKVLNHRPNLKLIPAEVNSARGNMPYKDWARNNRSSYAKNEAAMKGLISLETIMEIEIVKMIENPNRIQ